MEETTAHTGRGVVGVTPLRVGAGDVAVVALVILLGELRHGVSLVADAGHVAVTVGSFAGGFVLFALLVGAYERDAYADTAMGLRSVLTAWVAGANVGLVVRTSPAVAGDVTWPFGVVVTGFPLLGLVAWRLVVGRFVGR